MFNKSNLSIELKSIKKSYRFQFKDTSLDSLALNPLDMIPRQNWVRNWTFLLSALTYRFLFH